MSACADMCRDVPTLSACETNHFDLIQVPTSGMRWHVSTPGNMPTCADMCQHVTLISTPLIAIILTLSRCWHVSAPVDMPTCADMCRHVPTCETTLSTSDSLPTIWNLSFMLACTSTFEHADMCWYVPTCADMCYMCRHVTLTLTPLIAIILTLSRCWYVSAHLDMPTCADMCRHVLTCADMCQHVTLILTALIAII